MKILICATKNEVGKEAAELVLNELKRKKNLVLGLATGKTMIPFYTELTRMSKANKVSYANVKTFNLDEYAGVSSRDKKSLRFFMEKNFFNRVNLKKENINFLDGKAFDLKKECLDYESKIRRAGGIDLQILGVGRNGHIGFNEPGSSATSRTRVVNLSRITREDNAGVPKRAVTLGIGTIMKAKKIIVLATGKKKARILFRAINGRIEKNVPVSFLQRHRDIVFILDRAAASELIRRAGEIHKKI